MDQALVARLDPSAPLLAFQLYDTPESYGVLELPPTRSGQEKLVFFDMLRVIVAGHANYFRRQFDEHTQRCTFTPTPTIDTSLGDIIRPLLDLASHHLVVKNYAGDLSDLRHGRVNQAMGAELVILCKDLVNLCSEIEAQWISGRFHLQDLILALGPTIRKFEHASALVEELKSAKLRGGAVLNLISRRLETARGSAPARELLSALIVAASRPFLGILAKWVYHGQINDPFNEFMVQVQQKTPLPLSQDWDKYYINESLVPLELSSSEVYNQVLLAGKYLEVISESSDRSGNDSMCDEYQSIDDVDSLATSVLDKTLLEAISKAYQSSNEKLVELLWSRSLEQRLLEFKHTFFLDNSDFLPTFLETVQRDLYRPVENVSIDKLQYALEIAIQQPGSISSEQHLDDLKVSFASMKFIDELLGIATVSGVTAAQLKELGEDQALATRVQEDRSSMNTLQALQLDFDIPFPQDLVISRSAIIRYQFLFRLFLSLRTTIFSLNNVWLVQSKSPVWRQTSKVPQVESFKRMARDLRGRILKLFQSLLYYCSTNVIEANWRQFSRNITNCKTVDSLQECHLSFLDKCLKECLLTRPNLLQCLSKLFKLGKMYSEFINKHADMLSVVDPTLGDYDQGNSSPVSPDEMMAFLDDTLAQYTRASGKYVNAFIDELSVSMHESAVIQVLLAWLETSY